MQVRWGLIGMLALVAGVFALGAIRVDGSSRVAQVGQPAPDFELPDLEGRMVRLSDQRGQVVLLNFWATWCPPCKEEMPILEQLHREMGDRVLILAVDRAEPPEAVHRFFEKYDLTFTALSDRTDSLAARYGLTGIPESYFIDKDGIIRVKYRGPMTIDQMREFVRKAEE